MLTKQFWTDALERAVRTFAQVILSLVTVDGATTELQANWTGILVSAGVAAALSLLMSVVASGTGNHQTAALVTPENN